jgi:hypothetical protein
LLLTIFLILLGLSLFFIVLGFSINESTFQIVGFAFLFLLSSTIVAPGNIEYSTGNYEYYVYGNNFTYANGSATYHWDYAASGVPPTTDKGVFLFHRSNSITYEKADSSTVKWFGTWLSIISGLGVALSIVNIRGWVKKNRGDYD